MAKSVWDRFHNLTRRALKVYVLQDSVKMIVGKVVIQHAASGKAKVWLHLHGAIMVDSPWRYGEDAAFSTAVSMLVHETTADVPEDKLTYASSIAKHLQERLDLYGDSRTWQAAIAPLDFDGKGSAQFRLSQVI